MGVSVAFTWARYLAKQVGIFMGAGACSTFQKFYIEKGDTHCHPENSSNNPKTIKQLVPKTFNSICILAFSVVSRHNQGSSKASLLPQGNKFKS